MSSAVRSVAAWAALILLTAGCSAAGTDKSGSDILLLRLATIDATSNSSGYQPGPEVFLRALPDVSGNRIQVDVSTAYGGGEAEGESQLVKAIVAGEFDGGWPATRAFAAAGIAGLAAIEAPMTITGYAAQRNLVAGHATDLVAASLDDAGLKSLGLMVGPLRRPFGVETFPKAAEAWNGMRFRSFNSPVQSDAIRALGATPVMAGSNWQTLAQTGELDGVEMDVAQYYANGFGPQAGKIVSNVVLWPKMPVLVLNQDLWDGLTDQQRTWIQAAADQAVQASIDAEQPEDEVAAKLCARDTRFQAADPGELLAMRNAVQPVVQGLAADPDERPLLREVRAVAELYASDTITVQDSCTTEANLPDRSDIPKDLAPIPDGTYRKQINGEDLAMAGLTDNDGTSGIWTLRVEDGHWYLRCRPLALPGKDCGWDVDDDIIDAGSFYGDDRLVWMVPETSLLVEASGCGLPADDTNGHCALPQPPAQLEWALDGRDLVFSSQSLSLSFEWILKPYERID